MLKNGLTSRRASVIAKSIWMSTTSRLPQLLLVPDQAGGGGAALGGGAADGGLGGECAAL